MKYKWIAQDKDGWIKGFYNEPELLPKSNTWYGNWEKIRSGDGKLHRHVLINLETHDYKIEDGILIQIPKRCKYADIFIEAANDSGKVLQVKKGGIWFDVNVNDDEYRIKPVKKTLRFRNYIAENGDIAVCVGGTNANLKWIGDWQNVEI